MTFKTKLYRTGQILIIAGAFYFLFVVKDTNIAYAADICADDLDIPDHTYTLTENTAGDCIITANNVTIDGDGLYSITGNVIADGTDGTAEVPDGEDAYDITILDVINVGGNVFSIGGYGYSGDVNGGNGGNITINNSNIGGHIGSFGGSSYGDGNAGNSGIITITNSNIDEYVSSIGGSTYGSGNIGNGGNIFITNSDIGGYIGYFAGYSYGSSTSGNSGVVTVTNSNITAINNTSGTALETISITDDAPSITLIGDENITLDMDDVYVEQGATAVDTKYEETDLTEDIITAGTVGVEAGTYDITYTVSDEGTLPTLNGDPITIPPGVSPNTTVVTRHVTRVAEEVEEQVHHNRVIGSSAGVIRQFQTQQQINPVVEKPVVSTITELPLKIIRTLKLNMTGDEVKSLQIYLNTHGYPIALTGPGSKGNETTKFGPLTKKAVMAFQKANGLTPDGIVGPKTLEKMK